MGEGFYQDFDRADSISYFKKSGIGLQEKQLLGTGSLGGGGGGEFCTLYYGLYREAPPKSVGISLVEI